MQFIIQTINGQIKHDFSFMLLEALEYHNWIGNQHTFEFSDNAIPTTYIPIGSIEFVGDTLTLMRRKVPKPRNVPESLFKFAGRQIFNGTELNVPQSEVFVKSNNIIKATPIVTRSCDNKLPPGNYQYSELVDFVSEWRAFIWRGELVGLQNYSGDFTVFPDVIRIKKMIKSFTEAPCAYTLDVGLVGNETVVVEVHDFFSCGLYGFDDLQLLPLMFGGWYKEYVR